MNTRDDVHFFENMAYAMELLGIHQQQLTIAAGDKTLKSPEFWRLMEELDAIEEALYLLKAHYDSHVGSAFLRDVRREAS